MIVLDTNVLSEPLRARPEPAVMTWLTLHPDAVITAVSVGEVLTGVARMPDGVRKDALSAAIRRAIGDTSSVLPYDESAARVFADLQEARRRLGRPLATEDGMIAAICIANGATLATRNVKDFVGLGLDIHNPWG